jgi:hypothetical protein
MIHNGKPKSCGVTSNSKAEQNYLHHWQGKYEQHHPATKTQNHQHHRITNTVRMLQSKALISCIAIKLTPHSSTYAENSSAAEHASFPKS